MEGGKKVTVNKLTLPNLTRDHLYRVLTCQADNSNLTLPLAATVTLDLKCEYWSVFECVWVCFGVFGCVLAVFGYV